MQQADIKGSSAKPAEQVPDLGDFRGRPSGPMGGFGLAGRAADDAPRFFYAINGGASVSCLLEEIGFLMGMVRQLASAIADSAEGTDPTAAQLAYAVSRFAEQADALASSAIGATQVQS